MSRRWRQVERRVGGLSAMLLLSVIAARQSNPYQNNAVQQGSLPFIPYAGSDIDRVNLYNGNLLVQIPLTGHKGRGIDTSFMMRYNSKPWYLQEWGESIQEWPGVYWEWWGGPGSWGLVGKEWGLSFNEAIYQCNNYPGNIIVRQRAGFTLTDADGSSYVFPNKQTEIFNGTQCDGVWPMPQYPVGHSNRETIQLQTDLPNIFRVWFRNGNTIDFQKPTQNYQPANALFAVKDTNGNILPVCTTSNGTTTCKDTLDRTSLTVDINTHAITVYDSNGMGRTYTREYTNMTFSGQFPTTSCPDQWGWDSPVYSPTPFTVGLLTKLTLPNGKAYTFSYQPPFLELTRITLPTGGYIRYTYATLPQIDPYGSPNYGCGSMDGRYLVERRVSPDGITEHVWTYQYSSAVSRTTTVTDPLGNVEIHTFSGDGYEIKVEHKDASGNLLKLVENTWQFDTGPGISFLSDPRVNNPPPERRGDLNARIISTTTKLADTNQVSKLEFVYDSYSYFDSLYSPATTWTRTRENVIQRKEYDWGPGIPGPLLRVTYSTYLHESSSTYLDRHIWDRLYDRWVGDGAGVLYEFSAYRYDETALTSVIGATQHDDANYGISYTTRGNPTGAQRAILMAGGSVSSRYGAVQQWLVTTNYYDTLGNLRQATDPGGHTATFSYSDNFSDGQNRNTYAYLTSITNALGHTGTTKYFYWTGLVASSIDPNNQTTNFSYDLLNRPLAVTGPDGGQTSYEYLEAQNPIVVRATTKIDASQNLIQEWQFDGLGRVSQSRVTSDPQGTVKEDTAYDPLGRKATVSNPYRSLGEATYGVTSFQYDGLGRVVKVIPPDGTAAVNNVTNVYSGNTIITTDQPGKKRKTETDALGRLVRVWEPDAAGAWAYETVYAYDVLDKLLRVNQKGGTTDTTKWRTRTYTYDSLSRLTQAVNPELSTATYAYDNDGNLVTKTDARNITVTLAYDQLHRLTAKTYSNGDPAVNYFYDQTSYNGLSIANGKGRRTGMSDLSGQTAWNYDAASRILSERRTLNTVTKTISYSYNLAGSLATVTYPSGRVVTFAYNASGHAISAQDIGGGINYATDAYYSPTGALCSLKQGASIVATFAFNNRLQPDRIHVTTSGAPTTPCGAPTSNGNILDLNYGFNLGVANNGNVVSITNNRDHSRDQSFTYDELNRVKTAETPTAWGLSFSYDIWANLLSQALTKGSAPMLNVSVNEKNQITNPGFSYDAAGNMLSDGSLNLAWDAENRLKETAGVQYLYDGDGQRVKKSSGKLYWNDPSGEPLAESDLAGNITEEYVFFAGARIARKSAGGTVYYLFADHLGSARVMTNAAGAIQQESDYYPFGGERLITNLVDNRYKFTGKERDAESGLDDFGARYYASNLGRFLSPDLVFADQQPGDPQSWNLYTYVRNNPLRFIDPTGHGAQGEQTGAANCQGSGNNDCVEQVDGEKDQRQAKATAQSKEEKKWERILMSLLEAGFGVQSIIRDVRILAGKEKGNKALAAADLALNIGLDVATVFSGGTAKGAQVGIKGGLRLISSAREIKALTKGLKGALEAHHILEVRHLKNWQLAKEIGKAPAALLSRAEHLKITQKLRQLLPYGKGWERDEVWAEYQKVYSQKWLQAIEGYFK